MPSNLQKRQWLVAAWGPHCWEELQRAHTRKLLGIECSLSWLGWWFQGRIHMSNRLYTSYMCNLFNVNYISIKLFFKALKESIQSLTIILLLPCFYTFFARELNMWDNTTKALSKVCVFQWFPIFVIKLPMIRWISRQG